MKLDACNYTPSNNQLHTFFVLSSFRSSVLQLFDKKRFNCVMTTDVMDESGLASEKVILSCSFQFSLNLYITKYLLPSPRQSFINTYPFKRFVKEYMGRYKMTCKHTLIQKRAC